MNYRFFGGLRVSEVSLGCGISRTTWGYGPTPLRRAACSTGMPKRSDCDGSDARRRLPAVEPSLFSALGGASVRLQGCRDAEGSHVKDGRTTTVRPDGFSGATGRDPSPIYGHRLSGTLTARGTAASAAAYLVRAGSGGLNGQRVA